MPSLTMPIQTLDVVRPKCLHKVWLLYLCGGRFGACGIYTYPPGSFHWHEGNYAIVPVPVKQPEEYWWTDHINIINLML